MLSALFAGPTCAFPARAAPAAALEPQWGTVITTVPFHIPG